MSNAMGGDSSAGGLHPDEVVVFGDTHGAQHAVSMKTVQAIYSELTGKSETLTLTTEEAIEVRLLDLEQLNHKFQQVCEQYNLQATSCSVSLSYFRDTREVFSSFERFLLYDRSSTSPVESVTIRYSFLIVLPKTSKPQSYTTTITLTSQAVMVRKLREKFADVIRHADGVLITGPTAKVTVEYVDYMVAKTLLGVAEGWVDALPRVRVPVWARWLRSQRWILPIVCEYSVTGLMVIAALQLLAPAVPTGAPLSVAIRFLILSGLSFFVAYRLGHFLGVRAERAAERLEDLGMIALNRGDELEAKSAAAHKYRALIELSLATVTAFLVGVAASLVANLMSRQ